jgi:thioredoxin reductase
MGNIVSNIIVGAGPFALSLGSHFEKAGLDYTIFGDLMGAWKKSMPPGMMLKSWPCSSNIDDPDSAYTLGKYCAEHGIEYDDVLMPLPIELFYNYADAFAARMKLKIKNKMLTGLTRDNGGFTAAFDDGDVVKAQNVVLAVGVHPFKFIPKIFSALPPELISHSGDYGPIDRLRGKRLAIVGAGASASGLAALMTEAGANVTLVAREPEIHFADPPHKSKPTLREAIANAIFPVPTECAGVAGDFFLDLWAQAPLTFHLMPQSRRLDAINSLLGPSGHCAMKDRVLNFVPLKLGRTVEKAYAEGGVAKLDLRAADGSLETFEADHVIASTGFKTEVKRLSFLSDDLKSSIRTDDGAPALTRNYESSVPGLYFVGPATASSFGPVMRFVAGARHSSRAVTQRLRATKQEQGKRELRPAEIAGRTP